MNGLAALLEQEKNSETDLEAALEGLQLTEQKLVQLLLLCRQGQGHGAETDRESETVTSRWIIH